MLSALFTCLLSAAGIWTGLNFFHSAWAAILLYHGVLVGSLMLRRESGVRSVVRGYSTVYSFVLILGVAGLGWAFLEFIHRLDPAGTYTLRQLARSGLSVSSLPLLTLYIVLINPVLEELYWRGNYAAACGGIYDGLFALLHLPAFCFFGKFTPVQLLIPLAMVFLGGCLLRLVAGRLGGLASVVIGHAAADLAVLAAIYFALK